jgi:vacuolar-type H+-ATPase subunit H
MEYLNLVNRIMEAERSAQDLVREAQERRPAQEEDLRREVEGIHTASMEHARSQVAEVEKRIRAGAQADLDRWDGKLKESMDRVENADRKYRENWVETLFSMIVKG